MFTTWFLKALWDVVSLFLSNFKYKIVSKNYFSRAMYAGLNEFWTLLKIFLWSFMKSLGKERGGQVITFSCCWATISDFSYYTSPEINYSSFPSREKKNQTNHILGCSLYVCPVALSDRLPDPGWKLQWGKRRYLLFLGVMAELLSTFNSLVPVC